MSTKKTVKPAQSGKYVKSAIDVAILIDQVAKATGETPLEIIHKARTHVRGKYPNDPVTDDPAGTCASEQLSQWLQAAPSAINNVWPVQMEVGLAGVEWFEITDIANGEGWTIEEAVSELAYRGLERYAIDKAVEGAHAEWKAKKASEQKAA